ncbi:hypothetical protein [Clostridium sp. DJ247]|nr:hypothetical protein [Clostridium sp. DJ247]
MKDCCHSNINNYKKLIRHLRLKKEEGEQYGKVSDKKANSNK